MFRILIPNKLQNTGIKFLQETKSMNFAQKVIYTSLNYFSKLILWIYFRRIKVNGKENIPSNASIIAAPNHRNTMIDPVLMTNKLPVWLHFMANYGLFKTKFTNFLMSKVFFCIPVKRKKDMKEGESVNNLTTIKLCNKILTNGGSVFMAPEGTSYRYRRLRPLKDGFVRIALSAAKRKKFKSNIFVLPIGINYSDPSEFRSEIVVNIGTPIRLDDFKNLYRKDKNQAAKEIMNNWENQLKTLTTHTENEEEDLIIERLFILAQSEGSVQSFEEQLVFENEKTQAVRASEDDTTRELWDELHHYFTDLEQENFDDESIIYLQNNSSKLPKRIYPLVLLFGGIPYLIGRLIHFAWYIPKWIFIRLKLYKGYETMVKILTGVFILPMIYSLYGMLLPLLPNNQWLFGFGILFILSAFCLLSFEELEQKWRYRKNASHSNQLETFKQKRKQLIKELRIHKWL
ncbi:MAG: 1-acyl-sn-glycerol-3-phosphate acyltransferase [Saprospiraceae bacterium]